MGKAAEITF